MNHQEPISSNIDHDPEPLAPGRDHQEPAPITLKHGVGPTLAGMGQQEPISSSTDHDPEQPSSGILDHQEPAQHAIKHCLGPTMVDMDFQEPISSSIDHNSEPPSSGLDHRERVPFTRQHGLKPTLAGMDHKELISSSIDYNSEPLSFGIDHHEPASYTIQHGLEPTLTGIDHQEPISSSIDRNPELPSSGIYHRKRAPFTKQHGLKPTLAGMGYQQSISSSIDHNPEPPSSGIDHQEPAQLAIRHGLEVASSAVDDEPATSCAIDHDPELLLPTLDRKQSPFSNVDHGFGLPLSATDYDKKLPLPIPDQYQKPPLLNSDRGSRPKLPSTDHDQNLPLSITVHGEKSVSTAIDCGQTLSLKAFDDGWKRDMNAIDHERNPLLSTIYHDRKPTLVIHHDDQRSNDDLEAILSIGSLESASVSISSRVTPPPDLEDDEQKIKEAESPGRCKNLYAVILFVCIGVVIAGTLVQIILQSSYGDDYTQFSNRTTPPDSQLQPWKSSTYGAGFHASNSVTSTESGGNFLSVVTSTLPTTNVAATLFSSLATTTERWENSMNLSLEDSFSNRTFECGIQPVKPQLDTLRIVGGTTATPHSWPWAVSFQKLLYGRLWIKTCGGTVVSPRHVITAMHCVMSAKNEADSLKLFSVTVGRHDHKTLGQRYHFARCRKHPRSAIWPQVVFDMALITLKQELDFGVKVQPVCLPPRNVLPVGRRCWAYGWGKPFHGAPASLVLLQVDLEILSERKCMEAFGPNYSIRKEVAVCAGGERGKDTCQGDSGGPLTCQENGKWVLYGATSWGDICGAGRPGVYAAISFSMDWFCCFMVDVPACQGIVCEHFSIRQRT